MLSKIAASSLALAGIAAASEVVSDSVLRVHCDSADQYRDVLAYLRGEEEGASEQDIWLEAPHDLEIDVMVAADAHNQVKSQVEARGAAVKPWIEDVQAVIAQQMKDVAARRVSKGAAADFFDTYQRYDTFVDKLREWADAFEDATFIPSIGQSVEGRDIAGISFGGSEGSKSIYLQGGIHAREWISPVTTMYLAQEMLASQDPQVRKLVDSIRIVVVPVLNPDGYEYTFTGNRLWRKNRGINQGSACVGTDLNRNWDDHFGGGGTSPNPCSDVYHGGSPFSSPETKAVEQMLMNTTNPIYQEYFQGYTLTGAIDFHAYGQLILRPFGWQLPFQGVPDNEAELKGLGDAMRDAIRPVYNTRYTSEHSAELYIAAGGADDWFYSVATGNGIGFCFELRDNGRYGFLLPDNQILPSGEETWEAMKVFLQHIDDK